MYVKPSKHNRVLIVIDCVFMVINCIQHNASFRALIAFGSLISNQLNKSNQWNQSNNSIRVSDFTFYF